MPIMSCVWIIDTSIYIDLIEEMLNALFISKTESFYKELVEWIICEELEKVYLLHVLTHMKNDVFSRIHNKLVTNYNLQKNTTYYLQIPRLSNCSDRYIVKKHNLLCVWYEYIPLKI